MRIEEQHGNKIVCGHVFKPEEIKVGSNWQSSTGSIVTVYDVDFTKAGDAWVKYYWTEQGHRRENEKHSFSFQCRYCLIVED